ncbi:catalase [Tessaracoccus sp. MC1627]|uniref:catalase n=1 Tax=Tessaracoccus sp. MC1627 TaxID=2760312 RepID=UPI001600BD98|nr:catalase [Tessaracoccus sp. MC1627]MBB1511492.1 catalase [Tessaracoccus sp. MC1627]
MSPAEKKTPPTLTPPSGPGVESPPVEEPTTTVAPPPPKPSQQGPATVTPTGAATGAPPEAVAQQGEYLTTSQGARLRTTDHSLKAGLRGPVLLQDHHLREKITHFDHERIPERVVHARGTGAHGVFVANGRAARICRAAFLKKGVETPVFVRFSTVAGFRGSSDTVRDTRGFATKFYTTEGNYDLVGNNIPVFFIQEGIKFPDIVHAVKPEPDREIPQAQSAHDTFWDFVSLHTEAQAHVAWSMSDRAIPLSYRMMEGFGIHTFRLINEAGDTSLVKFHWKPKQGIHSQVWEETQLTAGNDPDFHRRDLYDAIDAGAYPSYDLGVQVMPDTEDETFEGIDLLDPTKLIPEELCPVEIIGTMTLNRRPTNFFAEVEQVMFNPGNLVPGIDVTNDPLLQVRLFSYIDTQITRLGGPNFSQIPINRAHCPVNDMFRDGFHQAAVHGGVAPYRPNSLDGGNPAEADDGSGAFIDIPTPVAGDKVRELSASFEDHFSQVTLFVRSLTDVEREHLTRAYTFELGKCFEESVRVRQLQCLANVDAELCADVARGLGLPAPEPTVPPADVEPSQALSQLRGKWPVTGRKIAVIVDADTDPAAIAVAKDAVEGKGMRAFITAPRGGKLGDVVIDRAFLTAASIEFDAALVLEAPKPAPDAEPTFDAKAGHSTAGEPVDPRVVKMVAEMYRHCKAIAVSPGATAVLDAAGVPREAPGVVVAEAGAAVSRLTKLLATHRVWERFPAGPGGPQARDGEAPGAGEEKPA